LKSRPVRSRSGFIYNYKNQNMSEKLDSFLKELDSIKHDRYVGSDNIERELQYYYSFTKNTLELEFNIFATDEIINIISPIYRKFIDRQD
jgi:hypothetical protein